jgi:hypothetical protein
MQHDLFYPGFPLQSTPNAKNIEMPPNPKPQQSQL